MSSKERERFTAEQKCMDACVTALDILGKRYFAEGDETDVVAQTNGKNAQARVLSWLMNFYGLRVVSETQRDDR